MKLAELERRFLRVPNVKVERDEEDELRVKLNEFEDLGDKSVEFVVENPGDGDLIPSVVDSVSEEDRASSPSNTTRMEDDLARDLENTPVNNWDVREIFRRLYDINKARRNA